MAITMNPQAEDLNRIIQKNSPTVFECLSKKGKAIYFPCQGILNQGKLAKGKEINATLGTAYEDDKSPMVLQSIYDQIKSMKKTDAFPYAPSEGINPLREQWKSLIKGKNPSLGDKEISMPVVTCALTHGLSMVGYLFVEEGNEIIVSDLYWENYDLVFTNGYDAELRNFNFFKNNEFDLESLQEALNAKPKGKTIVLLNFPNNPSGYTPSLEMGKKIVECLKEHANSGNKTIVILDDAYFGLSFETGIMKESLFAQLADAHENLLAIKVDGITKEDYAWGFRVGFVTYGIKNGTKELYKALEEKTAGALRGNISNVSNLSQSLFLNALNIPSYADEKKENSQKIEARYLKVKQILEANKTLYDPYFEALPFNSGYFMCLKLKNVSAEVIWKLLLDKYSTGVICYSEKNLLRIAFASTPTSQLEKLFNNVFLACKESA